MVAVPPLLVLFGLLAGEELIFEEPTTGAENDIEQATTLARGMVTRWGMSERLGPVYYQQGEDHVFLGKDAAWKMKRRNSSAWHICMNCVAASSQSSILRSPSLARASR